MSMKDHMIQALTNTQKFKEIRAKLREAMFQILAAKDQYQTTNFFAKNFLSTDEGHLIGGIIKDYLESSNLLSTLSVFTTEVGGLSKVYSRDMIEKVLNRKFPEGIPILISLISKENVTFSPKGKIPNLTIPSFKPKNNLLDLLDRPKDSPNDKIIFGSSNDENPEDRDMDFQDLLQVPEDDDDSYEAPVRKKSF
ncbi:hypothetical protein SteCoe_27871 [Stentor coeruleus]|uniref:FGFR1 oncogene partner (FOP) N-terminal dimerisation domain-containing protein n=1 Tax=Stentor coeruleus TaxID=5963 RepID=A0A1R2B9R6_9CILI|nr:hypothetical protein SteCoe_27871 [Stentor coeruleus]